jgi:hypothetical protein
VNNLSKNQSPSKPSNKILSDANAPPEPPETTSPQLNKHLNQSFQAFYLEEYTTKKSSKDTRLQNFT